MYFDKYITFFKLRAFRNYLRDAYATVLFHFQLFVYRNQLLPLKDPFRCLRVVSVCGIPVHKRVEIRDRIRVGLLVDEFFGGGGTAIGGYGALARKYICKYIPSTEINVEVLLEIGKESTTETIRVEDTTLFRLPKPRIQRQRWLDNQGFNLFVSIEMTEPSFQIINTYSSRTPLIYWIQDPRDLAIYQPRQRSVQRLQDADWSYIRDVEKWLERNKSKRCIEFISQGKSLTDIARKMYSLSDVLSIEDIPNPIDIDYDFRLSSHRKKNNIVFLGRLEAQKRVWIVCEIAKRLPQYNFYVLGATGVGRGVEENTRALAAYRNADGSSKIRNLTFAGHVDGEQKATFLRDAKLLVNTSIWEGIPVSWLEALAFGTLLVAAFDRDDIVSRFGSYVGEVFGDGVDDESLGKFSSAITAWMDDDEKRISIAEKGIQFVRQRHSVDRFVEVFRRKIMNIANR